MKNAIHYGKRIYMCPSPPGRGRHREAFYAGSRAAGMIAVFLMAAALWLPGEASAAERGESCAKDESFLVKYRSCNEADGRGHYFDVLTGTDMEELRSRGLLEWYEPDGDAYLIEPQAEVGEEAADGSFGSDASENEAAEKEAAPVYGTKAGMNSLPSAYSGRGVRVGVIDSGINPHPGFGNRLLPGHNYTPEAEDEEDTTDRLGHGTMVAGLITASENGVRIGLAAEAEIVPLKVTDGEKVKISAVCSAIYGGIDDYGCSVLNLSLGAPEDYEALKEAVEYAESKNVTIISSVGNDGNRLLYYPAAYESVVGVGSVDKDGKVYRNSNHNSSVFLTAPGVMVNTTDKDGGYANATGTSFSTPMVSGAAAVLAGADRSLTPAALRRVLAGSALDAGEEGYDEYYGYGILNPAGAVDRLFPELSGEDEGGPAGGEPSKGDEGVSAGGEPSKDDEGVSAGGEPSEDDGGGSYGAKTEGSENGDGESPDEAARGVPAESEEAPSDGEKPGGSLPLVDSSRYGCITVSWNGDAKKYAVYRRGSTERRWKKLGAVRPGKAEGQFVIRDTGAKPAAQYTYAIAPFVGKRACDPVRNPDKCLFTGAVRLRCPDTVKPYLAKATAVAGSRTVVTIGYSLPEDLQAGSRCVILRQEPGRRWKRLRTLKSENAGGVFVDSTGRTNAGLYRYAVQVIAGRAGSEYESGALTVRLP